MKTIVLAYHNMGCVGIRKLIENGFEIVAVFTHKDDASESQWFESVAEIAASENIPVYAPDDINHPLWLNRIKALDPEILFSFYYRKMVGREILSMPAKGCLNLHGSFLPQYRGRCPINWALVNGETETGVTLHFMTEKPDDGDIVIQKKIPITDQDTAKTVNEKTCRVSAGLLDEILPRIKSGDVPRTPQDHSQSSYFGGRRPEDGQIDSTQRNNVFSF